MHIFQKLAMISAVLSFMAFNNYIPFRFSFSWHVFFSDRECIFHTGESYSVYKDQPFTSYSTKCSQINTNKINYFIQKVL